MKIIIGISGASGAIYGIRLLQVLAEKADVETHLILSNYGRLNIELETEFSVTEVEALANEIHSDKNLAASVSSGSSACDAMIVAPCSIKTLSGIVNCYAGNLLVRAADVTLKEKRPLILLPRETPLHLGHTRLLHQAAEMGVQLVPPMPAFYNKPQTIDDIIDHTVGRVLDLLHLDHKLFKRWQGKSAGS